MGYRFHSLNGRHHLKWLRMTKLRSCETSRPRETNWKWPTHHILCLLTSEECSSDSCSSDTNIKEKEKLEKYQGLREEQEKMLVVKKTVLPVVITAQGAVTNKLGE